MQNQTFQVKARLALTLVSVFAIATLLLTHTPSPTQGVSSLSGLMALRATAATTVPYESALTSPKPALIEFYANWCTTCQALAPTLQVLHEQYQDEVNFVMLNIDDPRWSAQVNQFQVTGVPQLTLLRANHTVAKTLIGTVPKQVLATQLQTLVVQKTHVSHRKRT